ncbi:MAG TPA: universal stress protein [Coleofasciculaceae cyanobacterium]
MYAARIHKIISTFGAVLKSVLVALDRSVLSESEIAMLRSLNLSEQSKVILVHVIPPASTDLESGLDRPHTAAPDLYRDIETHLEAYQKRLPCPSAIEITCGEPAAEIVRLANIHHTDLIILGSRGLSGIDRILQGSVSSEVLEQAPCSVLVVKAKSAA